MPDSNFRLEAALRRIRDIQQQLQHPGLPFEEALRLYEEADALIRGSRQYLTEAELRLQILHPDDTN